MRLMTGEKINAVVNMHRVNYFQFSLFFFIPPVSGEGWHLELLKTNIVETK